MYVTTAAFQKESHDATVSNSKGKTGSLFRDTGKCRHIPPPHDPHASRRDVVIYKLISLNTVSIIWPVKSR